MGRMGIQRHWLNIRATNCIWRKVRNDSNDILTIPKHKWEQDACRWFVWVVYQDEDNKKVPKKPKVSIIQLCAQRLNWWKTKRVR